MSPRLIRKRERERERESERLTWSRGERGPQTGLKPTGGLGLKGVCSTRSRTNREPDCDHSTFSSRLIPTRCSTQRGGRTSCSVAWSSAPPLSLHGTIITILHNSKHFKFLSLFLSASYLRYSVLSHISYLIFSYT